jgi:Uma2 family endonuclease
MPFMIDDAFLPATLASHPMTDEEFAAFCAEHPDLSFEMTAEGEIIVMPPTAPLTGDRNSEIDCQLRIWAKKDGRGRTYDSSTGFVLPNGARRSPDASWILKSRIAQLAPAKREGAWHFCPDFVIELRSPSDRPRALENKMREYLANGAQLGWLIDPGRRAVTIYRPNREPETLIGIDSIQGEDPVAGFVLHLSEVWNPLDD